jgi:SAM-dependent methyltransferase
MQRAASAGFEPEGIDLAPWVEEVAQRRGVPNVRACRIHEARYPDASFDVAHASQVFEHLPRPLDELEEIRRVLRPEGCCTSMSPTTKCLSIVLGRDDFELNTPPEHVTYFTPRTLAQLVARRDSWCSGRRTYGGLKWENLLGRPISSEIAEAVRPLDAAKPPQWRRGTPPARSGPPTLAGRAARNLFSTGV